MWRMHTFYDVLSRTIFLLLRLGFLSLDFLLSTNKTMNAHAFFVMVAFGSSEIHFKRLTKKNFYKSLKSLVYNKP